MPKFYTFLKKYIPNLQVISFLENCEGSTLVLGTKRRKSDNQSGFRRLTFLMVCFFDTWL